MLSIWTGLIFCRLVKSLICYQRLYSVAIFNLNVLGRVPHILLNFEAFESNTTSAWLNHTKSCICFTPKVTKSWKEIQLIE